MGENLPETTSSADLPVPSRFRPWIGPLMAVGLAAALYLVNHWVGYRILNPPLVFATSIVLSAYLGGLASGLAAAFIALGFTIYDWTIPGHPLTFAPDNLQRLLIALICLPGMAILVGILKARADSQHQTIHKYSASLRESEQKFAKAFNQNPAISTISRLADGTLLDVNEAFCRIFGWRREEAIGRTAEELNLWTESGQRNDLMAKVKLRGGTQQVEAECRSRSGETHILLWDCETIHLNEEACLLVSAEDITVRKQMEKALCEAKELVEAVVESSPDMIWSVDAEQLSLLSCNQSLRNYFLTELGIVLRAGTGLEEMFPDEVHRERWRQAYRRALAQGPFAEDEPMPTGNRILRLRFNLLKHGDSVLGVSVFGRDITEARKAEAALQESEARNKALLCAIPDIIFMYDRQGEYLVVSATDSSILIAPPEALRNRKLTEFLPEPVADMHLKAIETTLKARTVQTLEYSLQISGHEMWFEARMAPAGQDCVLSIVRDVSERKRAEDERRRMEERMLQVEKLKALGLLVAGVAHNLNNVLAVIMGTASLREIQAQEPLDREAYRNIGRASTRGREVVKSLIHFGTPSLPSQAPFELTEVVGEIRRLLENTTQNRIEILAQGGEESIWVLGSSESINLAILNLCFNALDAMPEGGKLTIAASSLGPKWAEVTVEDNGKGMPPEVLAHSLEPFFTTKHESTGAGLGLSMTYGVVKAHGGTMDIASQPGQGTIVKLRFPKIPAPVQVEMTAIAKEPVAPLLEFTKVFLVDDEEDVRFLMTRMLKKAGVRQVKVFPGGKDVLEALASEEFPDLIILDQNMPGMNGTQTMERIRNLHPEMPILVSSGQPDIEEWDCFKQSRVGVISKPFTMEEIMVKLTQFA